MGRLGRRLRTRSLLVYRSFRPYGAVQSAWRGQKLRVFTRGNYRQNLWRRVLHVFPLHWEEEPPCACVCAVKGEPPHERSATTGDTTLFDTTYNNGARAWHRRKLAQVRPRGRRSTHPFSISWHFTPTTAPAGTRPRGRPWLPLLGAD